MTKKTVGVLFTSGLDSTYLVYKNLEEGNNVILLYINRNIIKGAAFIFVLSFKNV